jgi:DEAD/DEAH box helicase domain-containing protein
MHTTAYWLTLPHELLGSLPYSPVARQDGVNGMANAMQAIATLLVMCDARDLGVSVGENTATADSLPAHESGMPSPRQRVAIQAFEPNIYLYDNYPGGIGLTEPLFRMSESLLINTKRLIEHCPCPSGCPSCVGPVGEVGEKGKEVALAILGALTRGTAQSEQ